MQNQTFRDPTVRDQGNPKVPDAFRVMFSDRVCSPTFNSIGAAKAYLDMLTRGEREPEYSE